MATEFDNALHWGLFLTGTTLTSETGKYVRVSELVLSALRATGVFSNMVDGIVAPATDKLWLDKNFDPAVLKEWDATGASWVPMSYGRLFGRAAVDKLVVTGGTGNAVVVSQSAGFQAARLYLMTPLADNSAAATINVSGVGTYGVTYGDGAEIGPTEFTAGRQAVLFFTGARFEVVFPLGGLSAAILAAQASASAAADSATLSQQYASNPEDVEVQPGLFSSRHYLAKVVAYWSLVTNTLAGWIHGAIDKPTPVGADEIGIADSAGGLWGLKRLSLTNLAAWLASLTQTLTNKTISQPNITGDATVTSTTAGASRGPVIELFRDTVSAPSSYLGSIVMAFKSSVGTKRMGAIINAMVGVATDGAERVIVKVTTLYDGIFAERLYIGAGVYMPGASGGDKGADTVNAKALYDNGERVLPWKFLADVTLSGTAYTLTGIPAEATEIEFQLIKVQAIGGTNLTLQEFRLGFAGGIVSAGYDSGTGYGSNTGAISSTGFNFHQQAAATTWSQGRLVLRRLPGTNLWVMSHAGLYVSASAAVAAVSSGFKDMAAVVVDRIQLTTRAGDATLGGRLIVQWKA